MRRLTNVLRKYDFQRLTVILAVLAIAAARQSSASVALLMEEPYGEFGALNPTGHAAVYLNHVCAETPTRLRVCRSGEFGVVISRYHKIDGSDWIAMPLVPYLYAVEDISEAPRSVDREQVTHLRDAYWRAHLMPLAPAVHRDGPSKGEWVQLIGSSFDRKIHGFQVETTSEQDERLIARFNDRRNVGHFNLFFHNCADFSRVALDIYFPHAVHRNVVADFGMTTPKQVARSLVKYGNKHPELRMSAFTIAQVPGTLPHRHPVDGVAESLVKSKKYLIPLAVLSPEVACGMVVDYLAEGRMRLPNNATLFEVGDEEKSEAPAIPVGPTQTSAARPIESIPD